MILSRQKPVTSSTQQLSPEPSRKIPDLETFLARRDYTGAMTLLEFKINSGESDIQNLVWLGYCAFHLGDYLKAKEAYEKVLKVSDTDNDVYLYSATCYFFLGMYEEADKAALKGPNSKLKSRLLFHLSHKFNDEKRLLQYHHQLQDVLEDQCSLASIHYLRNHYQESIDVYKRLLLENKDCVALNAYMAMCYYKLDYYDVSQEFLNTYLSHYPSSIIALNLKACNIFKLYNGKAAEAELKIVTEQPQTYKFAEDLLNHNMCVFKDGQGALAVLTKLLDVIPEARFNLIIYHLKNHEIDQAYQLASDIDPSSPLEYILKGVVNAVTGEEQKSKEHVHVAQQFFHLVGSSASECDTIPGRQCMASSFILLKQFEDALLYLDSIKTYFQDSDTFYFNYGQTKLGLGEYLEAEENFLKVKDENIKTKYSYISQLAKCYIRNAKPELAWELYLNSDTGSDSFNLLIFIANECYKTEEYLYAAKAFDVLEQQEPSNEFWTGKCGSSVGVFKQYMDGTESKESVQEVMTILRNTFNPEAKLLLKSILKHFRENQH